MEIRRLTSARLDAANDIAMRAYQSPTRLEELQHYLRLQPDGWLLAYADERPVGLAGAIDYGPFAYVGLVSVLPDAQRGGIGRTLMEHILAWLTAHDCPMVLLDASPAGQPLYARLGFVADDASVVWRQETPSSSFTSAITDDGQALTVLPLTTADLAEVAAFDRPRFSADRTAVLADLLACHPGRAALMRDTAGRICGFAIAQARNLGPWLADDQATAAALLAWTLALAEPPTGVLMPAQNPHAVALLTAAGFAPQRQLAHMRLGGTMPRDRSTHYGLASFALG